MRFSPAERSVCDQLVRLALEEDLNGVGDLTSLALIPSSLMGEAAFVARSKGVLAGVDAVALVFEQVDPNVALSFLVPDGATIEPGTVLLTVSGPMRSLLTGERTALNFLQRLSGIASLTQSYVHVLGDLPCKLLDTRKTTPGWRLLEKYAVRMGGGHNHRIGLYDGILIKDNHLAALGGDLNAIGHAIQLARSSHSPEIVIEIEVDHLDQFDQALAAQPHIILLDNMPLENLREAVLRRNLLAPEILLEASGGIGIHQLRAVAETGVDRISIGALTHSAKALDIGLDYVK